MPSRLYLNYLLCATCILCGVSLFQELSRKPPVIAEVQIQKRGATALQRQRTAVPTAPITSPTAPGLKNYQEILMRPLFSRKRLPPSLLQRKPLAPPPKTPPPLELVGLAQQGNQQGVALLRHPKDDRIRRVSKGESLHGWKLERVMSESVLLSNGTRREKLGLPQRPGSSTPPIRSAPTPIPLAPETPEQASPSVFTTSMESTPEPR